MIIVNTEQVPGRIIESTLGMVRGNSTRAKLFLKDILATLKNIVGGEVSEYTNLLNQTRDQALQRLTEEAEKLGADAVVNIRFTTSAVAQGVSEILAYGTAVKLVK